MQMAIRQATQHNSKVLLVFTVHSTSPQLLQKNSFGYCVTKNTVTAVKEPLHSLGPVQWNSSQHKSSQFKAMCTMQQAKPCPQPPTPPNHPQGETGNVIPAGSLHQTRINIKGGFQLTPLVFSLGKTQSVLGKQVTGNNKRDNRLFYIVKSKGNIGQSQHFFCMIKQEACLQIQLSGHMAIGYESGHYISRG